MPLIEELPTTSSTRVSHGWAYVPDSTGPISVVQSGSRKRGRDGASNATAAAQRMSAKQEKAIQQRLHDLDKENHREIQIPVPKRDGAREKGRKVTANVRRILAYSRTFQHYLADEEAGLAAGTAGVTNVSESQQSAPAAPQRSGESRRRGGAAIAGGDDATPTRAGTPRRTSTRKQAGHMPPPSKSPTPTLVKKEKSKAEANQDDVEMADAHPGPGGDHAEARSSQDIPHTSHSAPPYDPALDRDPLLRTRDLPKMPSDRVMQILLAEPPLSYNAASAKPVKETGLAKPQRWFCCICGYWGKVRCKRGCGERVCGLMECWRGHESVCVLAAY